MNLLSGHFTRLADFSGRENRKPFWLWLLIVYAIQMVVSVVLMVPLMLSMTRSMAPLMEHDQAYLDAHPELAGQVMLGVMGPMMRNIFLLGAALGLLMVALIAAAVVRRLHDTNRSGYWALPMLILQIVTLAGYAVIFPRFFGTVASLGPEASPEAANAAMASILPLFGLLWLLGLIGFIFMVILIVFLATRGTIGPNRYGDDLLPPPPVWPQHQQYPQHPQHPQQWTPPPMPAPPPQPARVVRSWDEPPSA